MALFCIYVFRGHPTSDAKQQPLVDDLLIDKDGPHGDEKTVVVFSVKIKCASPGVDNGQEWLLTCARPADVDDFKSGKKIRLPALSCRADAPVDVVAIQKRVSSSKPTS